MGCPVCSSRQKAKSNLKKKFKEKDIKELIQRIKQERTKDYRSSK